MTLFFASHQITIYRSRQKGVSGRFGLSATFTVYNADIQPSGNPERLEMAGERFGAVFDGYIDATVDIKEGDQVVTSDGKRYSVRGVITWQGADLLDHKQLILISQDG